MTTLKKIISVDAYVDIDGERTCARSFERNEFCQFYRLSNFGTKESCVFAIDSEILERRDDGMGSLIPLKNCPIWEKNYDE
jgi:hypothetical protein